MKKIISTLAALAVAASSVTFAQGLSGVLGAIGSATNTSGIMSTVSDVVYAYTGNTTAVDLPGNWTYSGSAISLGGDNMLSDVAGKAASSAAEGKLNDYLNNVGITAGDMKFTFNKDLSFVCTVKGVPVNGTWKTLNDGKSLQLQFGKEMKYFSMTGALENSEAGCKMLFEGKKFLSFVKSVLAVVAKQNGTASTISSFAENYNDMKLGFNLKKD